MKGGKGRDAWQNVDMTHRALARAVSHIHEPLSAHIRIYNPPFRSVPFLFAGIVPLSSTMVHDDY